MREIFYLTFHGVGVDLTHVSARVLGFHIADVQLPRVVTVVCDRQPRIESHHICLYSYNCFRVRFNPGHLQKCAR